jgi:hypothetical protein
MADCHELMFGLPILKRHRAPAGELDRTAPTPGRGVSLNRRVGRAFLPRIALLPLNLVAAMPMINKRGKQNLSKTS